MFHTLPIGRCSLSLGHSAMSERASGERDLWRIELSLARGQEAEGKETVSLRETARLIVKEAKKPARLLQYGVVPEAQANIQVAGHSMSGVSVCRIYVYLCLVGSVCLSGRSSVRVCLCLFYCLTTCLPACVPVC